MILLPPNLPSALNCGSIHGEVLITNDGEKGHRTRQYNANAPLKKLIPKVR